MIKNTASQTVAFQMNSATDGSAVTSGTPTVYYTIDGGTQGTGAGASTHEGNGCWSYVPAQAETNGAHVAFTMAISGAITQTVNIYPVSYNPGDADDLGLTALTGHTPQTGDNYARLGAPAGASVSADVAAVQTTANAVETDTQDIQTQIGTAGAGLTDLGGMSTTMKGEVNTEADTALTDYDPPTNTEMAAAFTEIKGATWSAPTDTLEAIRDRGDAAWITATSVTVSDKTGFSLAADQSAVTIGTVNTMAGTIGTLDALDTAQDTQHASTRTDIAALNDPTAAAIATSVLTTQMTEAYAADGAAPTLAQALFAIQQFLQEKSVASTTLTVNKLDGTTAAMTFTLNSDTAPTSITRAT